MKLRNRRYSPDERRYEEAAPQENPSCGAVSNPSISSIPDLLSGRKTCPEETIYQLGTLDDHASAEDLLNIVTEFIDIV